MDKKEYVVHREVLDDARLDEVAQKGTWSTQLTIAERVKESFRCSVSRLKLMVLSWVPVLSWLPHYPVKENIMGDLISGCSVAIMHLSQALSFLFHPQILLGVVKFGFVVNYLSEPLVRAYTTGSAFLVCVSQLKYIFGITLSQFSGPLSVIYTLVDICQLLPKTKVPELLVSVVALTILIAIKGISAYYRQKLPLPIPVELFLIVAATLATHFGDLNSKYDIGVVGQIPNRLEAPSAPDATLFTQLIGDAFAVAVVSYTTSISLAKTFALKHGYKVENNQELLALGLSNTVGGFFQCYSVTACLSRTLVQESTGGKTQVAGIFSSIILLIAILQIGSFFEDLPMAVLATIVVVNLKGMFEQFVDLPMLWTTNKVDLLVWLVTFISTILLNLDLGLAVSVGFAIITLILRIQRTVPVVIFILGLVSGTDLYLEIETYKEAKEIPGIKIFRSSATINYTNAEMYVDALQEKSGIDFGKLLSAHKKQEAELKQKQDIEKNKAKKKAKKQIFLDLGQINLDIYLAGCQVCVVKPLETGFFSEFIPKSKLFVTVHDAVLHVRKKHSQTDLKPDVSTSTKMLPAEVRLFQLPPSSSCSSSS
ncbi:prestin-like [Anabas testudineus]|uniref:prestin-like n=1 Tax=Anabas testudineus TaxID=64144 RepID=UPI000E45E62B|nr:prestin-like [Anabas testudineus]